MKELWKAAEEVGSPTDPEIESGTNSDLPDRIELLAAGIVSLLLHMGLIFLLSLSLGPAIMKEGPSAYQVTLRPFPPLEEKIPDNQTAPDLRRKVSVASDPLSKSQTPFPSPSMLSVKMESLTEEPKQALPNQKEEDSVKEPIPLPMAAVPSSSTESDRQEDPPVVLFTPSRPEKPSENAIRDAGPIGTAGREGLVQSGLGDGSGSGQGGPGQTVLGDDGTGIGEGGSRRGDSGEGQGTSKAGYGGEGFNGGSGAGHRGSGGGTGLGHRGPGWGSAGGSGAGIGSSGGGGSGKGGAGVARPGYAENPKPIYPVEARERGYQGEVLLRVEVLSNGKVGQIEVKRSSGHEVLDQSALATVKKWRFIPARKGDVPIPFWVNIPIKFELL